MPNFIINYDEIFSIMIIVDIVLVGLLIRYHVKLNQQAKREEQDNRYIKFEQ